MVYVKFLAPDGRELYPVLPMERIPGPGDLVRLGAAMYVVQAAPVRHEYEQMLTGLRWVHGITLAPEQPPVVPEKPGKKCSTRKQKIEE